MLSHRSRARKHASRVSRGLSDGLSLSDDPLRCRRVSNCGVGRSDPNQYRFEAWNAAYLAMAAAMSVGIITTLLASGRWWIARKPAFEAVTGALCPFATASSTFVGVAAWCGCGSVCRFFQPLRQASAADLGVDRLLSDLRYRNGVMANVFYTDMGFSMEIASVTKVFGVIMTLAGAAIGGVLVFRWHIEDLNARCRAGGGHQFIVRPASLRWLRHSFTDVGRQRR